MHIATCGHSTISPDKRYNTAVASTPNNSNNWRLSKMTLRELITILKESCPEYMWDREVSFTAGAEDDRYVKPDEEPLYILTPYRKLEAYEAADIRPAVEGEGKLSVIEIVLSRKTKPRQ